MKILYPLLKRLYWIFLPVRAVGLSSPCALRWLLKTMGMYAIIYLYYRSVTSDVIVGYVSVYINASTIFQKSFVKNLKQRIWVINDRPSLAHLLALPPVKILWDTPFIFLTRLRPHWEKAFFSGDWIESVGISNLGWIFPCIGAVAWHVKMPPSLRKIKVPLLWFFGRGGGGCTQARELLIVPNFFYQWCVH